MFLQQFDLHIVHTVPIFRQTHLVSEHLDVRPQVQQPTKRSPCFERFATGVTCDVALELHELGAPGLFVSGRGGNIMEHESNFCFRILVLWIFPGVGGGVTISLLTLIMTPGSAAGCVCSIFTHNKWC